MRPEDRWEVAELICISMNYWYQVHGFPMVFAAGPQSVVFRFDTYSELQGSSGIVVVDSETKHIIGSCFVHERPTHVSLGLISVHPNHARIGVAGALLRAIVEKAEINGKPLRLVSSAMNMDSYSLFTRAGFTTVGVYQKMMARVPAEGFKETYPASARVRPAKLSDLDAIIDLERDVASIERPDDYRFFLRNGDGNWHVSVCEGVKKGGGDLDGVLVSCLHPTCNMIGPGSMRNSDSAIALLRAELNVNAGRSVSFLVSVGEHALVDRAYAWGARNCELHLAQIRGGQHMWANGIVMPTFMPESN